MIIIDGMMVAQRDLPRITSTFQAIKLEFVDNGLKGEHNNKHSRWQMGMNNRRDWEQNNGRRNWHKVHVPKTHTLNSKTIGHFSTIASFSMFECCIDP